MLSSITPLGERAKGNSWGLTAAAYVVGSALGGALLGLLLAPLAVLVGQLGVEARLLLAAVALLAAAVLDATSVPIPTTRRQVNENWLNAYRGWVYGAGFGLQLGFGVVTIITSWSTWAVVVMAVLTGTWWTAVVVATVFGLARGLVLLLARHSDTPADLAALHKRIADSAPSAARATRAGMATIGVASGVLVVAQGVFA
ncbi:MAG: hypothetical protein ACR2OH_10295 [Microthrixaceae bacterium]